MLIVYPTNNFSESSYMQIMNNTTHVEYIFSNTENVSVSSSYKLFESVHGFNDYLDLSPKKPYTLFYTSMICVACGNVSAVIRAYQQKVIKI